MLVVRPSHVYSVVENQFKLTDKVNTEHAGNAPRPATRGSDLERHYFELERHAFLLTVE